MNGKHATLHIKNMVCGRCIKVVKEEFEKLNLTIRHIRLGEVEIEESLGAEDVEKISQALGKEGFELIDDKKSMIIKEIKTIIINEIHHHKKDRADNQNFSDFLEKKIGYEYSYLSNLFSSVEGITIEKFIISQKIERVKELLVYNELTLNEIAWQLGYSSVQHLSNQFKKVTGLTPSHYKEIKNHKRQSIDNI